MLLILEGPDGAGKSTLLEELRARLPGALTVHHGPAPEQDSQQQAQHYMASLRPALVGKTLILDRSWLSEPIYAEIFRKAPSRITASQRRMLERAALSAGGVVVLCLPPLKNCLATWRSRREQEMLQKEAQLREAYARYAASSGLDTALPVVAYDYTAETVAYLLHRLEQLAPPRPRVLLLGERPSGKTIAQGKYTVPFVTFNGTGCSDWLSRALDEAAIPEQQLVWRNVFKIDGTPIAVDSLPSLKDLTVIALGRRASSWCLENGVAHRLVPRPQSYKRFYHHEPYSLIPLLKELTCVNG